MILLVFLSIVCSVFGVDPDGMKLCEKDETTPYNCLFKTKTERLATCCYPILSNGRALAFEWNFPEKLQDGLSSFMSLNTPCKAANLEKPSDMNCVPREGITDNELSPYPIHRSQLGELSEEHANFLYCSNKFTSVYDFILTCWLYDCEPRLKIPQKARGLEKQAKNLCLPPILHKENKKKYCALYSNENADEESCFLPPVCGKDGKIDESEYLVPLVDGKPNAKYCEVLCPSNSNGGTFNGKPCRQVPICPPKQKTHVLIGADFNNTQTNPQKMHICNPFCTVEDSKIPDPKDRKVKDTQCQPLPPCKTGAHPDAPFTGTNPFGALECIHIEQPADVENPEKMTAGIIVVCVVIPLVVIGLVVGGVFFVLRRRRSRSSRSAMDKTNVVILKTMSDTPHENGRFAPSKNEMGRAAPSMGDPVLGEQAIVAPSQDAISSKCVMDPELKQPAIACSGKALRTKTTI